MAYRSFDVFTSAARTAHASSGEVVMQQREAGVRFDVDITAFTGTSITFTIQYYENTSGTWLTLLASAALSAAGHTVLQIDPRIPTAANAAVQALVPRRLRVTPSGTITSVTYGVVATPSS